MAAADRSQVCRRPGIVVVALLIVVFMYVRMCTYVHVCMSDCLSVYLYVCLYACLYVCVCMYVCVCVCVCVCVFVCMYVSMYVNIALCSHSSFNQTVHLVRELLNTTIPVCLHMAKRYLYIPSMFHCALQTLWRCVDSSYAWVNCFSRNQLVRQDIILKKRKFFGKTRVFCHCV